jgi:hypothetical protein
LARISSQQKGITNEELREAVPDHLSSKDVHLYWVDKSPDGQGKATLTAKIEFDGQLLLLKSKTEDPVLVGDWDSEDLTHHTNARLLALERILTDPANEDILLTI